MDVGVFIGVTLLFTTLQINMTKSGVGFRRNVSIDFRSGDFIYPKKWEFY